MFTYKKLVENLIETLLVEDDEQRSSKINAKGAFGSGSWANDIGIMQSRAFTDPKGLLKDLGVKSQSGNSDSEKAASIISQAVANNSIMKEAFSAPKKRYLKTDDGKKKFLAYSVESKSDQLTYRLATKYICITLTAAENAGILTLKKGIKFASRFKVENPTFF